MAGDQRGSRFVVDSRGFGSHKRVLECPEEGFGGVSRAAKGADCKSAGYAFVGSSPTSPTIVAQRANAKPERPANSFGPHAIGAIGVISFKDSILEIAPMMPEQSSTRQASNLVLTRFQ